MSISHGPGRGEDQGKNGGGDNGNDELCESVAEYTRDASGEGRIELGKAPCR